MVARDGIEPSTRGFSVARRAGFGVREPKTGNEFSQGRPNRPGRPSPDRTRGVPARRIAARTSCGSWGCPHRDRAGTEPGRLSGGPGQIKGYLGYPRNEVAAANRSQLDLYLHSEY